MTGVAIFTFIVAAFVLWGVIVDRIRDLDQRRNRDADEHDRHAAYMREVRRHADNDIRWRR
jgi:hypothetical protein